MLQRRLDAPAFKALITLTESHYKSEHEDGSNNLFAAQNITLPGVPSLDTIGQAQVWVVLAFIAIAVVVIIGGGGFFILRSLLQVLITMQSSDSEDRKKIDAVTISVDNMKAAFTPALKDVASTNEKVVSGLDQLRSSNSTITGQIRQIVDDNRTHNERLLEHYTETTKDLADSSNASGAEILNRLTSIDGNANLNTDRIVRVITEVPNSTLSLMIVKFAEVIDAIDRIPDSVVTDKLKAELSKIKTDVVEMVKDNLNESARRDVEQIASNDRIDVLNQQGKDDMAQIDKLTHAPVVFKINDADANRNELDKQRLSPEPPLEATGT